MQYLQIQMLIIKLKIYQVEWDVSTCFKIHYVLPHILEPMTQLNVKVQVKIHKDLLVMNNALQNKIKRQLRTLQLLPTILQRKH